MYKTIIFEKHDDIVHIKLNRPDVLNSYSIQMRDDLSEALGAVRDDPDVRAVIFSGVGRAYCAGADLTEFGTAPSPVIARDVRWERDLWGVLRTLDKLTIVAMHGYAFGSGLELALLCDIRIVAAGTKLGLPETALGMIPAAGGTQSLPRAVQLGTALRLILNCERIDADEAFRVGLVHKVVAADELLSEAESMAKRMLEGGPRALKLAKEAINRGLDMTLEEGLRLEAALSEIALTTQGALEGVKAWVNGTRPRFRDA